MTWYGWGLLWWIPPVRAEAPFGAALPMKFLPSFPLLSRAASALLTAGLLLAGSGRAELSETPIVAAPPVPPALAERTNGQLLFGAPVLDQREGLLEMGAFPSVSRERVFQLGEDAPAGRWLGPLVTLAIPQPDNPAKAASDEAESAPQMPRNDPGNVSFKRAAASLNVQRSDVARPGDLSRQFDTPLVNGSVAPAVPLSGWTVISLAGMVVIIVLAIGFHQRDSRRRKHRHREHHRDHRDDGHRHRHRHRRRSHGET